MRLNPSTNKGAANDSRLPQEWRLRQQLRTRHLLLLQALSGESSLSQAARALSITQPAATKLLAQLEDLLQLPLFERLPRGLKPTEYGVIMIRHAQAALGEIGAARDALAQTLLGAQGRVSVGAVVGSLPQLTSPALAQLLAEQPRLSVSVTVETSGTLVPMLERGELDLVVGQVPASTRSDDLTFEALVHEPLELIASAQHPAQRNRRGRQLSLGDLMDDLWVLPPPASPLRMRIDAVFYAAGLALPLRVVETASTLLATTLAQTTRQSVAVLSKEVARHYAQHPALRVLDLTLPGDLGTIGIVTRRRQRLSAAAANVVESLRRVASEA